MDSILITGAGGYVGREVVTYLLAQGKPVIALDRFCLNFDTPCVVADLTDADGLDQALGGHSFSYIIHLASLPGDTGDPQQMVGLNVNGCLNLLEYARKTKMSRVAIATVFQLMNGTRPPNSTLQITCRWTRTTHAGLKTCTRPRSESRNCWPSLITTNTEFLSRSCG